MEKIKKKWITVFLILGMIACTLGGSFIEMNRFEKKAISIELNSSNNKTIVFYRDDCPECQSVFPLLYYHNLFQKDLFFVNMNQPSNRQYIQKYQLKSVPTLIQKNRRYSGTNRKKISRFLTRSPKKEGGESDREKNLF